MNSGRFIAQERRLLEKSLIPGKGPKKRSFSEVLPMLSGCTGESEPHGEGGF